MECEENLLTEQIKCREVVKARCDPLETELKQLKTGENGKNQQIKDRGERLTVLEREVAVERDMQTKLRHEITEVQRSTKT